MRATFISAHSGTRGNESSISRLAKYESRIGRSRGRQEIEKFRVPRGRQGNEVRNEISSFDESEDEIALETRLTGLVYFFTNLRIASRRDQIVKSAEMKTLII